MSSISLLNKREFKLSDKLTVLIPTLEQYRDKDLRNSYDGIMGLFITTPSNKMVELDNIGIDFTQISEYDFFLSLFYSEFIYASQKNGVFIDSSIIFKDLDFTKTNIVELNNQKVIVNDNEEVLIDEHMYMRLSSLFCELMNVKKYRRKPGDKTAKEFIIECERKHLKHKHIEQGNIFDEMIIALVCESGFPYDFKSINELTLYDFYVCVKQIVKRVNYTNITNGIYCGFGTIDTKNIKESAFNFLSYRD